MTPESNSCLAQWDFGDRRLTKRAIFISEALFLKYGQPLSQVFKNASELKRTYEFLNNPKTSFQKVIKPNHIRTAHLVAELPLILAVGDTTYLDYKKILAKRDQYGPIGNGGNGLILHSALAINPDNGQPLGLLWEKLWHREHKKKKEGEEKSQQKGKKKKKTRTFKEKESYRWVEAFDEVNGLFNSQEEQNDTQPRIIHVFDREGDLAEVFEKVTQTTNTGIVVRAAHNRAISESQSYLWEKVASQPVQFEMEIELPKTKKHSSRQALLAVRYTPVKLRSPERLKNLEHFDVYGVYAVEIDPPDGEEPVEWMLLTTEQVLNPTRARVILRWYTYRWRIEEYHKILKSGCNAESYRLKGNSMAVLLGFFTQIAAQLLKMTYLNRTEPETPATSVLSELQIEVLQAKSKKSPPSVLTVAWAIKMVARLGGYLEHRKNSPIGITVLWRGWLQLQNLCEGWELRSAWN